MSTMAIVTPSYRPDLERFERLHESVLRYTADDVMHHVIVPGIDAHLYRGIGSPRLHVWTHQDVIPAGLTATDRLALWTRELPFLPASFNVAAVNLRRPWVPVRGWVLQQILKLAVARRLEEMVLVYIDSDVVVVRPIGVDDFLRDGFVRLYAKPGAITPGMDRHYRWCRTAHELLGLPWREEESYPDFVAGIVSWNREVVERCLSRVEQVSRMPWAGTIAVRRHFSEWILYGTFVRELAPRESLGFQRDTTLCLSHWSPEPLRAEQVEEFAARFADGDLAVHVQSKSGTDDETVRAVIRRLDAQADDHHG